MEIKAINSTPLRENQSFGRRGDRDGRAKRVARNILVVTGATAVGVAGASYGSSKLLRKMKTDTKLAFAMGEFVRGGAKSVDEVAAKLRANIDPEKVGDIKGIKKVGVKIQEFVLKGLDGARKHLPKMASGEGFSNYTINQEIITKNFDEALDSAKKLLGDEVAEDFSVNDLVKVVSNDPEKFKDVKTPLVSLIKKSIKEGVEVDDIAGKIQGEFSTNLKGQNLVKIALSGTAGTVAAVGGLTDPDGDGKKTAHEVASFARDVFIDATT